MNTAGMIEAAIRHEECLRDQAAPADRHFWDGWDAEAVRGGEIMATVTTSARGNGYTVVITSTLTVFVDGKAVAYVPDTEEIERVDSRVTRRAGGLEAYAIKRAAALYGAGIPVRTKHHA